jgi:hypothetical protein
LEKPAVEENASRNDPKRRVVQFTIYALNEQQAAGRVAPGDRPANRGGVDVAEIDGNARNRSKSAPPVLPEFDNVN